MSGETRELPPVQRMPDGEDIRRLMDGVTDYAIYMLDVAGVVKTWNRGAEQITGFAAADIIGRSFSSTYPRDAVASGAPERALSAARDQGRLLDVSWRVRRDGRPFWAKTILRPLRGADGTIDGFTAVTRDLTASTYAGGDSGAHRDEPYRLLVESVKDYSIFMLDPNGVVVTWNEGAHRMKGYSGPDIIGKHFSVFYPDEALTARWPWQELEFATAQGRFEDEGWRIRKDGSRFWANVVITALRAPDGELVGFAKVTRDLTERKAAEEALRQSEERYRLLVAGVTDYAIFMLDKQGHVLTWNEGAQRIKGYSAAEIIGQHFSKFYPHAAVEARWPWKELEYAAAEGRFEDEGWRVRKDGSLFWANVIITSLRDKQGRLYGFSKITRDMTDRRMAEERIRSLNEQLQARVDELAASNREVAQKSAENEAFVYSVSHDVRAPLVNLQGFSHEMAYAAEQLSTLLAAETVPPPIREQAAQIIESGISESVKHVQAAVAHLSNIVDGLLRLSRAGRIIYQTVNVPLKAIVDRIIESQNSILNARGAQISVDDLPSVSGDPVALEQLFSNLIANALNYLQPGRRGEIRIGALPLKDDRQVIFVRDNGAGLSDRAQAKLFQVFQRFHPHLGPGEGMGLAIAHRIVQRHNGKIWVESTLGEGTTFYVALPGAPRVPSK